MKIQGDLNEEESSIFNQYKEENNFETNYKAIKSWIKDIRFNQERKEEIKEVPIKSEFEKLIDIIKD